MDPIADFLASYQKAATRKSYRAGVLRFLDAQYGPHRARAAATADEFAEYERLATDYLAHETDHAGAVVRFIAGEGDAPPKSVATRVAGVIQFLQHHGIDLSDRERRRIRQKLPRGGAVSRRGDLDHAEIREVLAHCDEHGRALFLVLASSGMRIGEALALRLADLDLEAEPATVTVLAGTTKNRQARISFVSTEAARAVCEWLRVRGEYLTRTAERSGSGCVPVKSAESDRLFPFSIGVAESHWKTALRQAGLYERDARTGRVTRSPHGLRGFFKSQLELGAPEPVVEELMGHEGYLSSSYRRYSRAQLAEHYLAAEHHVTILVPAEYKVLKSQVSDRLAAHSEILENMVLDNVRLKDRVQDLERQNATILEAAQTLKAVTEHPLLRERLRERERE